MTDIIVKGPVLGPGWIGRPELGLTDRPLTAEEIQKAAHDFLSNNAVGSPLIDSQHEFIRKADLVEHFITSQDYEFNGRTYSPGTWFMAVKVTDKDMIKGVLNGEYTGFSVSAWPENQREKLEQKLKQVEGINKGLFSNTKEGEWFALAVSIAKLPFYPEAVFKVFKPDEIIKKNIPDLEVDKVTEEDKGIGSAFNKLLDFVINKEVKTKDIEELTKGQQFVTEEMLDKKLDAHYKKMEELLKEAKPDDKAKEDDESDDDGDDKKEDKEAKKDSKDSKTKDKKEKAKDTKEEDKEEDDDSEDEESEEESDDTLISKAIKIDDVKKDKSGNKTFMEECGLDAQGRNAKYL